MALTTVGRRLRLRVGVRGLLLVNYKLLSDYLESRSSTKNVRVESSKARESRVEALHETLIESQIQSHAFWLRLGTPALAPLQLLDVVSSGVVG